MSYSKKHSKIKNTAILFELLTRQITVDVINNTDSKAVKILKEFFSPKTQLGKENELYKILIEKKYKTSEQATVLLEAVIKNRRKLSNRNLKNEKYNLIKTIKETYDINEFFNSRIPNYKILASIYNVFEGESSKENFGPIVETDSKLTIIENITTKKHSKSKKSGNIMENQDKDLRLLTYQLLVEKFNKKYSSLNKNQRNLLKEYINNLSNTNSLREFIVQTSKPSEEVILNMGSKGFLAGIKYSDNEILVAVTEKRTKDEIDSYVSSLQEVDNA